MKRRGYVRKLLSLNFGHAAHVMVNKLYGKFAPRTQDLVRAKRRAEGGA